MFFVETPRKVNEQGGVEDQVVWKGDSNGSFSESSLLRSKVRLCHSFSIKDNLEPLDST